MARRFAVAVAVMMTVLVALAAPSWAHHKAGHPGGAGKPASPGNSGGGGGSSSGYTEDNDTNDNNTPNNVPDAGDNAHPSGQDKSVEPGNSGNQGNSASDPDDDGRGPDRSNGGADKPNGPGGVDLADQDGNNGCGNDDDFEDDNEGWCGKPQDKADEDVEADQVVDNNNESDENAGGLEAVTGELDLSFGLDDDGGTQVLGESFERDVDADAAVDAEVAAAGADVEPLPREATEAEETGTLPFTGAGILGFVVVGLGLISAGLLLKRSRATH